VPTAEHGLTVSALTGQAGSFALGPVSLAVAPGQVLAVLGPSGAGKTMLLETIAGLRPQRSGRIRLAGADLTVLPPERRRIGMVFQDAALFPHLSVRDNIRFGPRASRQPSAADADALLHRLGIWPLASRAPRSLSGGERQRVALARALAISPALLLLDEPLSALDQPTREDMRVMLQQLLADLDIPAMHVTHDRDEALSIGDDLALIIAGQVRQTGPAGQVTAAPADPDAARLLGWTELGHGTAESGTARIGRLLLPGAALPHIQGPVRIFYRPEDLLLGTPPPGATAGASLTTQIQQILPTRPLARIFLATDPPVTALLLHRDLESLHLQAGEPVTATLPPSGVRIFPAT
jgi:ABC-type Fe3+/spermidine/putrescine transport system ATPase subunit